MKTKALLAFLLLVPSLAAAQRIAPDGKPEYEHDDEGPDDMPAHIRSVLTNTSLSVPIAAGHLQLGTWQGIYLWEHRHARHSREIIVTVFGEV